MYVGPLFAFQIYILPYRKFKKIVLKLLRLRSILLNAINQSQKYSESSYYQMKGFPKATEKLNEELCEYLSTINGFRKLVDTVWVLVAFRNSFVAEITAF